MRRPSIYRDQRSETTDRRGAWVASATLANREKSQGRSRDHTAIKHLVGDRGRDLVNELDP
jgi:hypothetical protein